MYVKICGLRDPAHAEHAIACGADAIGVVMSPRSSRHATLTEAAAVLAVASGVDTALVVNRMDAAEAARLATELGFDVLQLHGTYTVADFAAARRIIPRVWRATSIADDPELRAGERGEERLLVDGAIPGSGKPWDLTSLDTNRLGTEWLLAGGLDPENVAAAITATAPGGVDVSSGVESAPGVKDPERIAQFISAARQAHITIQ